MNLTSFEAVFFTVGFLVPGFVWSAVLTALIPRRRKEKELHFLEFLTLSSLSNAPWLGAWWWAFRSGFVERHPVCASFFGFLLVFVWPAACGTIHAVALHRGTVGRLGKFLGINVVHHIPTAWDWFFSRATPCWTKVTLRDGGVVYGLWGTRSFASSDPDCRDIYLEIQYRLEDDRWEAVPDSAGVWIPGREVVAIEFIGLSSSEEKQKP